METMNLMNHNYLEKRNDKKGQHVSSLGMIQKKIIDAYMKSSHSKEDMSRFEANLCSNSVIFGDKAHIYPELESVSNYFKTAKNNQITNEYENSSLIR